MKRKLMICGTIALLCFMFAFPAQSLAASKSGLKLWLFTMLPTLLPFMILSNILIGSDFLGKLLKPVEPLFQTLFGLSGYGAYALVLGLLCGYPMGAKLSGDLYREGKIPYDEACYLLTFANNASPMFISTYLVLGCLKGRCSIAGTYAILYASAGITSLYFRFRYHRFPNCQPQLGACSIQQKEVSKPTSMSVLVDTSIMNGFSSITRLGGYILLFSIFSAGLSLVLFSYPALSCLLSGLVEISTGLHIISLSSFPFGLKYLLSLSAASFGGLCIIAQTKGVISGSGLPLLPYVKGKLLNMLLTVALVLIVSQVV